MLLEGPFIGTAVRSCLATSGKYLAGLLAASKKNAGRGHRTLPGCCSWKIHFVPLLCPVAVSCGSRRDPPFPGASLMQGLIHVSENTAVLVCRHMPACTLACCWRMGSSPSWTRRNTKEGSELHHGFATLHQCLYIRDTDGACLGFTSHMGRAHKRHHLSLWTHRELVLRPPQPGELWCTRVEFCHNTAQSSSAAKSEQGACDSAKPEERNHFLAYLPKSGDVAHGQPPFLSFLPPTLHVSGPPTTHILLALWLRSVWLVPWGES